MVFFEKTAHMTGLAVVITSTSSVCIKQWLEKDSMGQADKICEHILVTFHSRKTQFIQMKTRSFKKYMTRFILPALGFKMNTFTLNRAIFHREEKVILIGAGENKRKEFNTNI